MGKNAHKQRRICVDTGGTFTDIVDFDGQDLAIRKVLSTPSRPERAVLIGAKAGPSTAAEDQLLHGSTVGLNAVLTGQGARLALVCNAGFEDLIEIARQNRPELYARELPPRSVLVPRNLRFGINERRLASGEIEARASDEELKALRLRLKRARVEAIAICLLHAHEHPGDEERIAEALQPLGLPITCSASLLRRHREYERFSTAIIDAFIGPVVRSYLGRLQEGCAPMSLQLVRNEGGTLPVEDVLREPARTLFSGPAAGVIAARYWAKLVGRGPGIGFDMGGTSADVALCGSEAEFTSESELGGHALALPSFPIASVGTGGGSLAYCDAGGALRVGPESAGADPGPACYGRGTRPTVTDAHLFLGRLPSSGLLGGSFALQPQRSAEALEALGAELGMPKRRVAEGILELADLRMARPLRAFTLGRGLDPAECCLIAFGGAGGLHAARLADSVGFTVVIVPPHPGVLSAMGMLMTGAVQEFEEACIQAQERGPAISLARSAKELARRSKAETRKRFGPSQRCEVFACLRYRGQRSELWVPATTDAPQAFETAFEARFGFRQELEIESLRLRARLYFDEPDLDQLEAAFAREFQGRRRKHKKQGRKALAKGGLDGLAREELPLKRWVEGPLAILDYSGTTIVEEAWSVRLEKTGALRLERR
ncbi:MAG: hypothetical protein CSA62_00720 [Planctomycetota bacterium]|nr:MAG: hypothetical protein CSA62_00720 [Planctomycetota bacterium]